MATLGLAACGGDGGGGSDAQDTSASAETTPAKPSCEPARKALVAALKSSLTIGGGGGLRRVYVAPADAPDAPLAGFRRGVYAVAGQFTGPGMDGTIGIWAVSRGVVRGTGSGLVIGADSVTREFSDFGSAATAGSPAAENAAAVADSEAGQAVRRCAEGE